MKKILPLLLFFLSSCSSAVRYTEYKGESAEHFDIKMLEVEDDVKVDSSDFKNLNFSEIQRAIVKEVLNYFGIPYKHGGTGEGGIDCSAFTMIVFKNVFGIILPRSSYEQFKLGKLVTKIDSLKVGDLLFFRARGKISHVGIYIGNGMFAHASVRDGVTVSSIHSTYYRKRFIGAKRIIEAE